MNVNFWQIYRVFLKIGAILLGGGYVIIPIMQNELIDKRKWLTNEELCDFYCVSQCLSGIIAINMSILVGCKMLKTKGAIAAVLGMATSPFISILLVANLINLILELPFIEGVFWGINLSVIVLIYLALKEIWKNGIVDKISFFWFLLILVLSILKVNPAYLIITSVFVGIMVHLIKEKKNA